MRLHALGVTRSALVSFALFRCGTRWQVSPFLSISLFFLLLSFARVNRLSLPTSFCLWRRALSGSPSCGLLWIIVCSHPRSGSPRHTGVRFARRRPSYCLASTPTAAVSLFSLFWRGKFGMMIESTPTDTQP